ncbi:aldehyde dehydrogenase [Durotheca rogersii]|uniref:aldehyde dehydrogenase n=1 Tax=Durotheca rogersii TaxID=419775 RepID=UPI00221F3D93|nr:aldehyde dehydrogenase [Durotheca rogersii]KAI5868205.1 aldehyde dehydrogenase [Durotheca rogersii]
MGDSQAPIKLNLKNPELFRDQAYVDGQWIEAKSGKRFDIIDPGSDRKFATCPDMAAEDVDGAVRAAQAAFAGFRRLTPRARADLLSRFDALIRAHRDDLATLLVYETGKPLAEAQGEIEYAASFTRWFAGEAERVQGTTFPAALPGRRIFTIKQPLGVVAALVPWNFPIAMVLRKASAALAAGCTMVAKPSPETPLTALTLAYLAEQAGYAKGVFNVLPTTLANTPALSEALCKHPLVKKVSFTGSTRVGKILSAHCADSLKKLTLELGGNCPFIVFDDANLEQARDALVPLKFRHAGQACITANRVYVQRGVYARFAELLAAEARRIRVGHGLAAGTTMGALTVPAGLDKVAAQVADATARGARLLAGGSRVPDATGYFFEPTVLADATPDMRIASEETFGPLLALFPFDTEEEAVAAANDTSMGLASYCFTKNVDRLWRLFENLEAGMIGLNSGNSSAAEAPFGGIKESGFGKESGKDVAINEYLITKTGTLTVEGQY